MPLSQTKKVELWGSRGEIFITVDLTSNTYFTTHMYDQHLSTVRPYGIPTPSTTPKSSNKSTPGQPSLTHNYTLTPGITTYIKQKQINVDLLETRI